jgi:hypothetical protein
MDKFQILILKSLRKAYQVVFETEKRKNPECIQDAELASDVIYEILLTDKPCMIARFGSTELTCLMNFTGVKNDKNKYISYIQGKTQPWWWDTKIITQMQNWSGFFPPTIEKIEQYCRLMLEDIPQIDVLGSWLDYENRFKNLLNNAYKIDLNLLQPWTSKYPWTGAIKGCKVLVIHPFAELISNQYLIREKLFTNSSILPTFKTFTVLKAVQTLGVSDNRFNDWFEALEYMKSEIDKVDYDVCLIGCGAYGFNLAAYVKRSGKKAIHLGGSLQLLFGIKGKRWDNSGLYNDFWVRPDKSEFTSNYLNVENGCYW